MSQHLPPTYSPAGLTKTVTLDKEHFVSWLFDWYQTHKRTLPWRETNDPYKIWLSEIILQQTRVAQGLPYYKQFVKKYPSIQDLARADEDEVLRLWQGLGYYSRARNLHACARVVVNELGGRFPSTYQALLRLKGVGRYTAAAIASIAFQESIPVVDGNVYRVLARVFGIEEDVATTRGIKTFYALAQSLIPQKNAGLYNQAVMEFGAIHCTPFSPQCGSCIFQSHCIAFHTNRQNVLPVKTKKINIKPRFFHYFVVQNHDKLYMKRRTGHDIWRGLYDFYLVEDSQLSPLDRLDDALVELIRCYGPSIVKQPTLYQHLLTHRRLFVHFWHIQATDKFIQDTTSLLGQVGMQAFTILQIQSLPKPILIEKFLKEKFYT